MVKIVKLRAALPAPDVELGQPGHLLDWVGSQAAVLPAGPGPGPAPHPGLDRDPAPGPGPGPASPGEPSPLPLILIYFHRSGSGTSEPFPGGLLACSDPDRHRLPATGRSSGSSTSPRRLGAVGRVSTEQ